jgi:hypothetical protein
VTATLPTAGPAPEAVLAKDLARRGVLVAPAFLLVGLLGWGVDGALSAGYGLLLVLANFAIAAALLVWAAPISLGAFMGAALFGYLLRLGLLFAAVVLVHGAGWVELWPLGLTIIVTHLGLLAWEARSVSLSLAYPGLKPRRTR